MSTSLSYKPPFTEIAIESIKKIKQPLLLYGVVETILLISLLVTGKDIPSGLLPIVYALAILVGLIAVGHFLLEYNKPRNVSDSEKEDNTQQIFARSDSTEFCAYIEKLLPNAQRLVLIGTGLNVLQHDPLAKDIMERAAQGHCQLEIYMADPNNPAVETRLIEEELGQPKPPVGKNGLLTRLDTLLKMWNELGRPEAINLNIFGHYPTFALLIVDRQYFIYPYGYATLGNFSPVLMFSKDVPDHKEVISFLDKQYQNIRTSSLNAETAFKIRDKKEVNDKKLHSFALFFIPPDNSDLYLLGSAVLGYDIRSRKLEDSQWESTVGGARNFGFHLTLCDVLYFQNEIELKSINAEIEFLLKGFEPFYLTDLQLKLGFPDISAISIVMKDPSGSLEALHHELVHRVYRRAAASNYSLGLSDTTRDQDYQRTKLMLTKYKAPYILQRFQPHFTLLTNIPSDKKLQTYEEIKKNFSDQIIDKSILVEKLAVMSRQTPESQWVIEKEIKLG